MNKSSITVTAAGMPRSASTWLYNAIRLILSKDKYIESNLSCGIIRNWQEMPKTKYMLIKLHGFNQELVNQSDIIFYSYRDLRDAISSQQRKFGGNITIEWADAYVHWHEQWMQVADFSMSYESMLNNKSEIILNILGKLEKSNITSFFKKNESININNIISEIGQLDFNSEGDRNEIFNEKNMFHKNHITDGRYGAWKDYLSVELASEISDKYHWWFKKYNYKI